MASRPEGDEWNIVDNDKDSQYYGKNFKFDFSYISSEIIKDIVKDYIWQNYKARNKVLSSLRACVTITFPYFNSFAVTRNITSFKELTHIDVDLFVSYLHVTVLRNKKKFLSSETQRKCLGTLRNIIRWCQIHRPNDVPASEIFTGNE
uniref:hypothetical protein n=1 Tax=Selenomonas sp. TaxID=2053611 RepID=UPI0025D5EDE5